MEYSRFRSAYRLTKPLAGDPPTLNDALAARGIVKLPLGVYNDGQFTILPKSEAEPLTELVARVFPIAAGKFTVFATDWMGRLFVTDTTELDPDGAAMIACYDLAEPASFTTEANFDNFHNAVAIDLADALLNLEQYRS